MLVRIKILGLTGTPPKNKTSDIQRKQMTTVKEKNVFNIAIMVLLMIVKILLKNYLFLIVSEKCNYPCRQLIL